MTPDQADANRIHLAHKRPQTDATAFVASGASEQQFYRGQPVPSSLLIAHSGVPKRLLGPYQSPLDRDGCRFALLSFRNMAAGLSPKCKHYITAI